MEKITQYDCYLCRNCRTIARLMSRQDLTNNDHDLLITIAITLSLGHAVPADYATLDHINNKYPIDDFGA